MASHVAHRDYHHVDRVDAINSINPIRPDMECLMNMARDLVFRVLWGVR